MSILNNYYPLLYRCPVVRLNGYARRYALPAAPLAYLDFGGATGSAKDGLAECMLALAVQKGALAPGQPVVEASSGSFAIALTVAARASGHPVILSVPRTLAEERKRQLQAVGAKLVFSDIMDGRAGTVALAAEAARKVDGYFVDYFSNDDNPQYHRLITGPRILEEAKGQIDTIVIGVGSGGTITGVGEYIRAQGENIQIVAVEPYESQAIGGTFVGCHSIPGLGAGFIPENYNPYVVDKVMAVTSGEAHQGARDVLRYDGVPACVSAGAVLFAARTLLEEGHAKCPLCVFSGRTLYE